MNCVPVTTMDTNCQEVAERDFISCWMVEENPADASEVRTMACAGGDQPMRSSRAWARH